MRIGFLDDFFEPLELRNGSFADLDLLFLVDVFTFLRVAFVKEPVDFLVEYLVGVGYAFLQLLSVQNGVDHGHQAFEFGSLELACDVLALVLEPSH